MSSLVIARRILVIRGHKALIDADLASLYGVSTKRLNQQVNRNRKRFPSDFVFRLTRDEREEVVAKCDHLKRLRFAPTMPNAFRVVFDAIRELVRPPEPRKRRIGFVQGD